MSENPGGVGTGGEPLAVALLPVPAEQTAGALALLQDEQMTEGVALDAAIRKNLEALVCCLTNTWSFGGARMRRGQAGEPGAYPRRSVPGSHNAATTHSGPSSSDASGCGRGGVPREGARPLWVLPPRARLARPATRSAK